MTNSATDNPNSFLMMFPRDGNWDAACVRQLSVKRRNFLDTKLLHREGQELTSIKSEILITVGSTLAGRWKQYDQYLQLRNVCILKESIVSVGQKVHLEFELEA